MTVSSRSSARRPRARTTPSGPFSARSGSSARWRSTHARCGAAGAPRASASASVRRPGAVVVGEVGAGSRVEYAAFGDTVNVAARLQSAAEPGSVLVDDATHRSVEGLFEWGEPRELELKGKSEPGCGVAGRRRRGRRPCAARSARCGDAARRPLARARRRPRGARGAARRARRCPRRRRRRRDRQEPPGARAARARGDGRELLARGPLRLVRRVAAVLAVPRPAARRVDRSRRRRARAACARRPPPPARAALRRLGGRALPVPRRPARGRARARGGCTHVAALARGAAVADVRGRRPALRAARGTMRRSCSRSRISTGPTPPRSCSSSSCSRSPRRRRCCSSSRCGRSATTLRGRFASTRAASSRTCSARSTSARWRTQTASCSRRSSPPRPCRPSSSGACSKQPTGIRSSSRSSSARSRTSARSSASTRAGASTTPSRSRCRRPSRKRSSRASTASRPRRASSSPPRPHSGARFALPLLEGVVARTSPERPLHELQRLGLLRQSRRWPQPEYRFRHALIQETAYRTLLAEQRTRLHRRAAEWLEERYAGREAEVLGLLAYHWLRAEDEEKAADYLLRAGDKARLEYALDEAIEHYRDLLPLLERRGERQEIALVLFKLALALHTSLRFVEANEAYQRAFEHWTPPEPRIGHRAAAPRDELPPERPRSEERDRLAEHPGVHAALRPARRGVAGADDRPIARRALGDLGRRPPLRLPPARGADVVGRDARSRLTTSSSGSSASSIPRARAHRSPSTSRSRHGEDTYLGHNTDWDAVGVRALDDRTVEFRLSAPAPYFMSVMNRPDGGPQPRHAIGRRRGRARCQRRVRGRRADRRAARAAAAGRASRQRRRGRALPERRSPMRCRSTSAARPT